MKKGNLLLVDDEEHILQPLVYILGEYADELFTASNGQDALDLIEKNEIHCIVCDINMPVLNGVDVIKQVRDKNNEVPFIFYTAHGSEELMMEAAKYGAFDFLDKPNMDGLEEVVEKALKVGINEGQTEVSPDDFMSEYQKLLENIK